MFYEGLFLSEVSTFLAVKLRHLALGTFLAVKLLINTSFITVNVPNYAIMYARGGLSVSQYMLFQV